MVGMIENSSFGDIRFFVINTIIQTIVHINTKLTESMICLKSP